MLPTNLICRVVRFIVHHEPIWHFDGLVTTVDAADHPDLLMPGDAAVVPCHDGVWIFLAVEEFDEFPFALANHGEAWFQAAVLALKNYIRRQTAGKTSDVYRDPVDGELGKVTGSSEERVMAASPLGSSAPHTRQLTAEGPHPSRSRTRRKSAPRTTRRRH